jgi:DNA-binding MarR family transcriptional regulator
MEWFLENYEWLLSGIGVFALGLIFQLFRKRTTPIKSTKSTTSNPINNQLKAKTLQFNQTVIQNSSTGNVNSTTNSDKSKTTDPELQSLKEQYFGAKNEFRTLLIKKLAEGHSRNSILQVRDITDALEDERGISQTETFHELEKLCEQGLIQFEVTETDIPTPYTRIKLTEKYFEAL